MTGERYSSNVGEKAAQEVYLWPFVSIFLDTFLTAFMEGFPPICSLQLYELVSLPDLEQPGGCATCRPHPPPRKQEQH